MWITMNWKLYTNRLTTFFDIHRLFYICVATVTSQQKKNKWTNRIVVYREMCACVCVWVIEENVQSACNANEIRFWGLCFEFLMEFVHEHWRALSVLCIHMDVHKLRSDSNVHCCNEQQSIVWVIIEQNS